mmetsp:Transcript_25429/g.74694  ORF Transcript_25429/g.74694 Transcript_25429/m.74694 type:complete len:209 (+) Transcript_25429:46-672(+)
MFTIAPRRRRWSPDEDALLHAAVQLCDYQDWNQISRIVGTRKDWQCRERWTNHLQPGLRKTEWTVEEDLILLDRAQALGKTWKVVAQALPGRTGAHVKNRYNFLMKSHRSYAAPPTSSVVIPCATANLGTGSADISTPDASRALRHLGDALHDASKTSDPGLRAQRVNTILQQMYDTMTIHNPIPQSHMPNEAFASLAPHSPRLRCYT